MDQMGDAHAIWQKTCEALKGEVGKLTFQTWFEPVVPYLSDKGELILSVPDELSKDYLSKYLRLIRNALEQITSRSLQVTVETHQKVKLPVQPVSAKLPATTKNLGNNFTTNAGRRLDPDYTFDNFVVGPNNRLAHAAGVAVASMKGDSKIYNPLFIYGSSGLGKTHLVQAIGNYVMEHFPHLKVVYVQCEQFVNEFIHVIANKQYDKFRNKYRKVDFLILDDIQFIENKEQMQEEFFHTFNALYESGKNIILTCDKPPQSLTTLENRLITRFSSGLLADITAPVYETRVVILQKLAEKHGVYLDEDVIDFIASNITENIRELHGAFNTLLAFSLLGNAITLETTKIALKDQINPALSQKLDAPYIMNVCANYFSVSVDDLKSSKRKAEIVECRHMAMFLCYTLLNMTYADIGSYFGNRNHATVIHGCNKIEDQVQTDPGLMEALSELKIRLKA